jgi:hypothetical protein
MLRSTIVGLVALGLMAGAATAQTKMDETTRAARFVRSGPRASRARTVFQFVFRTIVRGEAASRVQHEARDWPVLHEACSLSPPAAITRAASL